MKAVIMCGGVGSRLRPLTESTPKPLVKALNRPIIDVIIYKLIDSGINEIYLSLGYMAQEIIEYCEKQEYNAHIFYCEEAKPLGTAGGVKNCIQKSDENILILSGDNIFDFDLALLEDSHCENEADITVCGIYADDPREYGAIVKDEDGSIVSFIEKPTWETAQSNLINTGIYLVKGKILDMIPENVYYDFSENLFPSVFKKNLRFKCYIISGFWGDMGEFKAYKKITKDILNNKLKNFTAKGFKIEDDRILPEGGEIIAPCLLGENFKIKKGARVGPYCVFGNNCSVGENTLISNSIIGDDCVIAANSDINSAILSDSVKIYENCSVEENTVMGYGCKIGRFSRILASSKIWPGKSVVPESVVSKDIFYETPESIEFDAFGISGKINSQFSVVEAAKIGQAIASAKDIQKIGIGCDDRECSAIYKELCASGMRTCGAYCYDFDKMYKSQAYFYSSYCSLDAFIFISTNGDIVNFSFFGKNGMSTSSRSARNINNNFRFSSFNFCPPEECKEKYNMTLFDTVYLSFLKKVCGNNKINASYFIESDSTLIKRMFEKTALRKSKGRPENNLQFLINSNGTDMYAIEKERFFSSSRILALICEIEFASGNDVIIPEDAPSFIEEISQKYNRRVFRMYKCNIDNEAASNISVLGSIWAFDAVFMCAKIINIMSESGLRLEQLFEYQRDFAFRKNIIEINCPHQKINDIIKECGAIKEKDGVYYTCENRKGKARIRRLGNAKKVSVLVEAADMEAAKEISADICGKFENAYIDKD